jgi:hypothetical protein
LTFLLNCCSFYITGISQHLLWWKECQVNGQDLHGMHHGKTTGWELLDHYFNYLMINEWLRVCLFHSQILWTKTNIVRNLVN